MRDANLCREPVRGRRSMQPVLANLCRADMAMPTVRANLCGRHARCNLFDANLSGADMHDANLSGQTCAMHLCWTHLPGQTCAMPCSMQPERADIARSKPVRCNWRGRPARGGDGVISSARNHFVRNCNAETDYEASGLRSEGPYYLSWDVVVVAKLEERRLSLRRGGVTLEEEATQ